MSVCSTTDLSSQNYATTPILIVDIESISYTCESYWWAFKVFVSQTGSRDWQRHSAFAIYQLLLSIELSRCVLHTYGALTSFFVLQLQEALEVDGEFCSRQWWCGQSLAEKAARSSILGVVRHTYNIILTQEMKLAVSGKYQHHFYILLHVFMFHGLYYQTVSKISLAWSISDKSQCTIFILLFNFFCQAVKLLTILQF